MLKREYIDKEHLEIIDTGLGKYLNDLAYPDALYDCHHQSQKFFNEHMFDWCLKPEREEERHKQYWKLSRLMGRRPAQDMVDLNNIFNCFAGLKLKEDHEIRYIAMADEITPAIIPFIVPKDTDEKAIDYMQIESSSWIDEFSKYVEVADTPEGYFDLALFIALVNNLYLYGHANYDHLNLLYTEEKIKHFARNINDNKEVVGESYTEKDINKLLETDYRPYVTYTRNGLVTVHILAENPWKGVFWVATNLKKQGTAVTCENIISDKRVIKYNCGIML